MDDVAMFRVSGKYHLVLAGPPCQPWSRAAGRSAKEFRDKRVKPFREVCRIVRECIGVNPNTAFTVENVVVNSVVAGDAEVQSRLLGAEFQEVTPTKLGWPQSRTRRIAQNVVSSLDQLREKVPFDPNVLLEPLGYRTDATVVPCVMASLETHAQMKLWDVRTQK